MLALALLFGHWALPQVAWVILVCGLVWYSATGSPLDWSPIRPTLLAFGSVAAVGLYGFAIHPSYDAVKDLWYFSKPLVEVSFGYALARRRGVRHALLVFAAVSVIVSLQYVLAVAVHVSDYLENELIENRLMFGPGSFLSLIPVLLLGDAGCRGALLRSPEARLRWVGGATALGLFAIGLSGSRTLLVLLLAFASLSFFIEFKRARRWALTAIAGTLVLLVLGDAVGARYGTRSDSPGLVERAVQEMTVSDYASEEDINLHWRGYESFMALRQLRSLGLRGLVIGGGFGQMVELEIPWVLSGVEFDAIPHLHNGYFYILVKTGFVGLLLFLLAIARLGRALSLAPSRARSGPSQPLRWWVVIGLVLATSVVTGPYNKMDLMPLMALCGVLAALASERFDPQPGLEPLGSLAEPQLS